MRRPRAKKSGDRKAHRRESAKKRMKRETTMSTPTQTEGENRDTVIGAVFALILEKKAKEYPDLKTFLDKIGMSLGTYYNLTKGAGNPTFWTVERTAKALGVSSWDLLGSDERLVRAWLAGQDIDIDLVAKRVEARRAARESFSLDDFGMKNAEREQAPTDHQQTVVAPAPVESARTTAPARKAPPRPKKTAKA